MNDLILSPISLEELEKRIQEIVRTELQNFKIPEKNSPSVYISRKEAAKFLGISLPTLSLWSKTGVIVSYRISSCVRYKREELEKSLRMVMTIKHSKRKEGMA